MKVYKLEVLVIDMDELGPQEIQEVLENARYPNRCISPKVLSVQGREIGEWRDDHPLNQRDTYQAEIKRLFGGE